MTPIQVFRSTLVVLLTLVLAYVLYISARIIIVLLIAVIIASALRPIITGLTRRRIPIGLAILIVYLSLAAAVFSVLVAFVPPVVNQVTVYVENDNRLAGRIIAAQYWVERAIADVTNNEVSLVDPEQIRTAVSDSMRQFRRVMPSMLDDISTTAGEAVLIFVMGAYWLTSHEKATLFLAQLSPGRYQKRTQNVIEEIEATMGGYVRGMMMISFIVGLLNFVPMQLLGIPNAITIAFMIAVTTAIPMIGGLIGIVVAALITLVSAPQSVLTVVAIAFIVQQIESYLLTPRIMADRVGLDPLLVIVYTAIGFILLGVVGALIAVPVMGTVHILLVEFVIKPYKESMRKVQTGDGLPVVKQALEHPTENGIVTSESIKNKK